MILNTFHEWVLVGAVACSSHHLADALPLDANMRPLTPSIVSGTPLDVLVTVSVTAKVAAELHGVA